MITAQSEGLEQISLMLRKAAEDYGKYYRENCQAHRRDNR